MYGTLSRSMRKYTHHGLSTAIEIKFKSCCEINKYVHGEIKKSYIDRE
jgi:hypothetical protein